METIKMCAIQEYYGQSDNGYNWFVWSSITIPEEKEYFIYRMNYTIPALFELSEDERTNAIDFLILVEHNNGINQYFPFLKEYASREVQEFIRKANSDTESIQKIK